MDVTVRTATAADVATLGVLRRQAVDDAVREYTGEPPRDAVLSGTEARLRERIGEDRYRVHVIETEVTAVCYGVLDRETGRLDGVFTSPKYQREGFASALLDRLESAAAEAGVETLTAVAPESAEGFFRSNGFDPAGRPGEPTVFGLPATRFETSPGNK